MGDYAKKRIKDHIGRFTKLYNWLKSDDKLKENDTLSDENMKYLENIEEKDCIFPEIDRLNSNAASGLNAEVVK